ncbi:hypothetical protein FJZ20_01475 [Candidatus Pacearchaeota archaeon]|nr:hypothetical protein [Candidatus Pacearchaeota archaeon]
MKQKLSKKTDKFNKKGVSPVIATVLLIAMVIIIGLIIFFWFRGLTKEAITKFGGVNVELVCEDVQFQAAYSPTVGTVSISNLGNVPIYDLRLKISGAGRHKTVELREIDATWPALGLRPGKSFLSQDLSSTIGEAQEILIIPVLLGSSSSGEQTYVCDERFGYEIY